MSLVPPFPPCVAIIIPAYNSAATIGRAIASALAEPEVAEVIVVDDASSDNTVMLAHAYDDGSGRLRIISHLQNKGPAAARNAAMRQSRAPWIGLLDADDYFQRGRIKALLEHAAEADMIADDLYQVPLELAAATVTSNFAACTDHPPLAGGSDFLRSQSISIRSGAEQKIRGGVRAPTQDTPPRFFPASSGQCIQAKSASGRKKSTLPQGEDDPRKPPNDMRRLLGGEFAPRQIDFTTFVLSNVSQRWGRGRQELGFIKPLMRRSFLEIHGLVYKETLRLGEDYDLYARALAHRARLWLVPAKGYVSVVRANSLSGQHTETDLLHLRDCDRDIAQIPGLSTSELDALSRHTRSVDCRLQWRLLINAVKQKDWRAALKTFARPFPVPLYLLSQLAEQGVLRSIEGMKKLVRPIF